jgi:hypothetical protein
MTYKHRFQLSPLAWAALALAGAAPAQAIEIETGNPNAVLRWDNTVRYNYGVRMKERDPAILGNPQADDGDRNFAKNQAVTNRLDLLSELDFVVDKKYGVRVSGAAWADAAYRSLATDANSPATYNGLGGPNSLSGYSRRFAQGPSGELLDAFGFASFDAGEVPVSVRLGRHTAFWGEGLLLYGAIHGVSYGQYALDIWKSTATPGTEAKELYRPRNGVTVQVQPTSELSITAQTFFEWEPARVAEAGTYLSSQDASLLGGQRFGPFAQGRMVEPGKTGDWGLSAHWSPEWLDGTLGLYARRTSEIANQAWLALEPGTATGKYHFSFASDISVFGASLAKTVQGVSIGAELSTRRNMPLVSQNALATALPGGPLAASKALWALADNGDVPGARGNTAHAVLNLVGVLPRSPLFDIATLTAETTWMRVLKVTSDPFNLYKGTAAYAAGKTSGAANIDAVTRSSSTLALSFTPSWLGALPELDLSLPLSYQVGLSGQAAVVSGGAAHSGTRAIGIVADYKNKYNLALRYIAAFGPYATTPTGIAAVAPGYAALSDRNMLVLTFKTTF